MKQDASWLFSFCPNRCAFAVKVFFFLRKGPGFYYFRGTFPRVLMTNLPSLLLSHSSAGQDGPFIFQLQRENAHLSGVTRNEWLHLE